MQKCHSFLNRIKQTPKYFLNDDSTTYTFITKFKTLYQKYLVECLKFEKQYVGKSEIQFNMKLNNHRKDITRKGNIPASNDFDIEGQNLKGQTKFIII